MKKLYGILFSILTFTVILSSSCNKSADIYELLNECVGMDYSRIELRVSTVTNGETLTGTYTVTAEDNGIKVAYTYRLFNLIGSENGEYVLPETAVSEYSGNYTICDGQIVSSEGDAVNINFETVTAAKLSFSEHYFSDIEETNNSFSATVVDPQGFLGRDTVAKDMRVIVLFRSGFFAQIALTYTTEYSSAVTLIYTFSR